MSRLRRYYQTGNIYFITLVTYERKPILLDEIDLLTMSYKHVSKLLRFSVVSFVILPDHIHCIIIPQGNILSKIVRLFKQKYSGLYRMRHSLKSGRLWQNRFWDHIIIDEQDFLNHFNYIHFNPQKHGVVTNFLDYPYSSVERYIRKGYYCISDKVAYNDLLNYGE